MATLARQSTEARNLIARHINVELEKIQVTQAEIDLDTSQEYNSWQSFNSLLKHVALSHDGPAGTYTKVWYRLTWQDGCTYEGRLDVSPTGETNVGKSMFEYIAFNAGVLKPAHLSDQEYANCLAMNERDGIDKNLYLDYLGRYNIVIGG